MESAPFFIDYVCLSVYFAKKKCKNNMVYYDFGYYNLGFVKVITM